MSALETSCPSCGDRGKGVPRVTLEHLLRADALAEVDDSEGYRHCPAQGCEVAYFSAARHSIHKRDVLVRIGTKETEAPRPLCYCFDHTRESIDAQLRETGDTDVIASITARCRAGEDRCPETNPQGSCCLGNVRRAVDELRVEHQLRPDPTPAPPAPAGSGGLLAAVGALGAAALASACCWIPLLLVGAGAGGSAFAGLFEAYRVPLLGVTVALLGVAYYFVWIRPARQSARCGPGEACAAPRPRLQRFNKIALVALTAVVFGMALFPELLVVTAADDAPAATPAGAVTRTYAVIGMTCASCASGVAERVRAVPGVASATVSYADKQVAVVFTGPPDDDAVLNAIEAAGYRGASDAR